MKKFLPGLLVVVFIITFLIFPQVSVFAGDANPPAAPQQQQAPAAPGQQAPAQGGRTPPPEGLWVADPEVTFIGKNAARSGNLLDWTLRNYNWVCVKQVQTNAINQYQCDDSENPLARFWLLIVSFIVVPLLFVVIIATAIVIIITRGKSLTIMKFIPRFVAVIVLIVFSYTLLSFLYQFTDVIQGFFLRSDPAKICPPNCISQKDLLYVGWKYEDFVGLRLLHDYYAESAFMSLLLTKLTALTYFVMVGILLMRKIILWFFIIVSPIFPLLLLYYPVRNTGKIWIGEFFRWLLYAPLFAMFLNGLVYMWRQQIPLLFIPPQGASAINDKSQIIYPTAVNILLGGPKQFVTPDNSVNLTETFALYVVALIMLWVVILLPWILLQIFLDYASNFSPGESAVMKTLVSMSGNKKAAPGGGGGGVGPSPSGTAISLPFAKKFQVPTNLTSKFSTPPTGAAKELKHDSTTTSRFAQPMSLPNAQIKAQALTLANVAVPSMRDIAKYDIASYSRDTASQKEVQSVRESLAKIANPANTTNIVEKSKYSEIRERLTKESLQGNLLATSILNAAGTATKSQAQANVASASKVSTNQMKNMMQQIAKPAGASSSSSSATSASSVVNKEKMTQLHDMLTKESKDNNNQLATSLLSVNEKTSTADVEKIKSQLVEAGAKGDKVATTVLTQMNSMAKQEEATTQVKSVLTQVANPATAKDPEANVKMSKMQQDLMKASKEGNDLATSILKVTDKTSKEEIEKIQEKIKLAQQKGDTIATQLASMTGTVSTAAPVVNRVQTVSKEDYDAVRQMWKENYSNLAVPEGMAGSRSDWIKDDIGNIDKIVGLLSSTDKEKVEQGMDEVSNILPFLLMGGFSQTEIIAYLKAKQDAAKDVVASIAADEETKVSVSAHGAAHAEKAMAANMEEDKGASSASSAGSASSSSDSGDEDASPLANLSSAAASSSEPAVGESNELLSMMNLRMPRMRDIVHFDAGRLTNDSKKLEEIEKAATVLEHIANPQAIADQTEKDKYVSLRQKLMEESQKGNLTAITVLSAAATADSVKSGKSSAQMKLALQQLANPALAQSAAEKEKINSLHEELQKAKEQGNPLASSLLSVQETTSPEEVEKLRAQLDEAKQKGEPIATNVLSNIDESVAVPATNVVQTVGPEEFEEVKKLWTENFMTYPVPAEFGTDVKGRLDWIKSESTKVKDMIDMLVSNDAEKKKEGMKQVSSLLPFLMLGGFSLPEIIAYLKAKQDGATAAVTAIEEEENKQVAVPAANAATEQPKEMAAPASPGEEKKEG